MKRLSAIVAFTLLAGLMPGLVGSPALAAPGDLDPTFHAGGIAVTHFGPAPDQARAVAIQPNDQKIVVAGSSKPCANCVYQFALARYNPDGSLDPSFGEGGKVSTCVECYSYDSGDLALAMAIQSDGKIVAAGYVGDPNGNKMAVARFNADGSLDTSFSDDGKQYFFLRTQATAVAIQPSDGKIVLGGLSYNGTKDFFIVVRMNTDGSLDTGFGDNGVGSASFGQGNDIVHALAIQPANGRIVVAGETGQSTGRDFALARFNTNGNLDKTFSDDGKLRTSFGSGNDVARAMDLQADGQIVVGGYSDRDSSPSAVDDDFALARYDTDGSLDTTFGGGDGLGTADMGSAQDQIQALRVTSLGRIIVAGLAGPTGGHDFAMARYGTGGGLDSTFGVQGRAQTDVGGDDEAFGLALQSDRQAVAAGFTTRNGTQDFAVVRYLTTEPRLSIGDATVVEGNSGHKSLIFKVTLSARSASDPAVTVQYATADGTAQAGGDYSSRSGTLTLDPGVNAQKISVPVRGDTHKEPDEAFTVDLSDPSGALITDGEAVGTILDNDPARFSNRSRTAGVIS